MVVYRHGGSGYHVAIVAGDGMCYNPASKHQMWKKVNCNAIWRGHKRFYVS